MAPEGDGDTSTDDTLSQLERDLYSCGFDIFHPFQPRWYNDSLERDNLQQQQLMRLPETGRAYLIGNTKHLWPPFKAWYLLQPPSIQDPLDSYCRKFIEQCIAKHYQSSCFTLFWSSKTQPDKLVSMQRVAMESGFAYHDPATQLVIHPVYGAWHSYRAAVVIHDNAVQYVAPPPPVPCLLTQQEVEYAREAMKRALEVSDNKNLCVQLHGGKNDPDMESVCKAWIAMRDCVERGKAEYRFEEDQLMYHYTKDVKYLKDSKAL